MYLECDMGKRIVNNIVLSNVLDYFEFLDEYSIVEIIVNKKIDGYFLIELDICVKFGLNIVVIKWGKEVIVFFWVMENI